MIREYFRNYRWNTGDVTLRLGREPKIVFHDDHDEDDWTVTIAETGIDSLTATRIHSVKKYLNHKEPFLLTYGDGLSNIDLSALLESHYNSGKSVQSPPFIPLVGLEEFPLEITALFPILKRNRSKKKPTSMAVLWSAIRKYSIISLKPTRCLKKDQLMKL